MTSKVQHAQFEIERVFPAAPARVFKAWADPGAHRRWFAPEGKALAYEQDFRVGGRCVSSFSGAATPGVFTNETTYLHIVPDARVVFAYTMARDGAVFSASLATVEIAAEGAGARMTFTEQATFFEGADGPDMRKQGWTSLIDQLGKSLGA